jgi:hypothetical protein
LETSLIAVFSLSSLKVKGSALGNGADITDQLVKVASNLIASKTPKD